MSELMTEIMENCEDQRRVDICQVLCTLLNNGITFMREQGLDDSEISEYLGCTEDVLEYIGAEDYERL